MIINQIVKNKKLIVAICDSELIGKKIKDNKIILDLNSNFYKGEEKREDEIKEIIRKAYVINAVGKKSVGFLVKLGYISEKEAIKVKNVPHVQILVGG